METIVEIVQLVIKTDIVPIDGILTRMLTKSKIGILTDVSKDVENKTLESKIMELKIVHTVEEHKIVEHVVLTTYVDSGTKEEVGCISIDEVVDTSIDALSCEGAKSDWTFDVSIVVTIKLAKVVSILDVAANFLGE